MQVADGCTPFLYSKPKIMKKTFFTLFVMLSMLWSMGASAQTLVFHLADGTTADVELSSTFRMSTVGSKTIVSLPDGSTEGTVQNVDSPVNVGVLYGTSNTLSITSDKKVTTTSKGDFTVTLSNLNAKTTYYYCAFAEADGKYYYGETKNFKTENPPVSITVTTKDATNVESTSAFLESLFTLEANTNSYTAGFFITTSGTPSSENYWKNVFSKESEIYYGIGIYATELSPSTTYFFRAYILYNGVYYYGETKSFTTKAIVGYLTCPDSNHPHMINLGLPSGTLWACCNVGASSPGAFGNFYAWQDTEPKSDYSWDNYWHTYVQSSSGNYLYGARSNIAGTSDDAATANWGRPWQMPTKEQCQELIDNCSSVTTTQNGNSGHKLTGPNGGSIFLPSAGYCQNKGHFYYNGDSSSGFYWTSMLNESATQAYTLHFMTSWETEHCSASSPNCGLSVRPVRKE